MLLGFASSGHSFFLSIFFLSPLYLIISKVEKIRPYVYDTSRSRGLTKTLAKLGRLVGSLGSSDIDFTPVRRYRYGFLLSKTGAWKAELHRQERIGN